MPHTLKRILADVINKPQLITTEYADFVYNFLNDRNSENGYSKEAAVAGGRKRDKEELHYNEDTAIGIIPVTGALSYLEYYGMCGEVGTSYQGIVSQFDQLIDSGAKTIILDVDSPGGMAFSMMETGRYLRKKADERGVQLIAYVDGLSASAAFGLSVAAHEIIANPDAELGSVGVVVKLRNMNKAMNNVGVEDTYIYAGDSKIPFKEDGSFREDFLADIQYKVDALYQQFTEYVADMRGIDVGVVKSTQAKVLLAQDAIKIGFADKVMTREDFSNYLADLVEKPMRFSFKSKGENKNMTTDVIEQESVASLQASLDAAVAKNDELAAALAAQNEAFEAAQAQAADLQKATADLAAMKQELDVLKAANEKAKDDARMDALKEVASDEEAVDLFKSTKALDDAAFAVVLKSLKAANAKEEEIFKEKGVSNGQATVEEIDPVRRTLLAKYHSQNK